MKTAHDANNDIVQKQDQLALISVAIIVFGMKSVQFAACCGHELSVWRGNVYLTILSSAELILLMENYQGI